MPKKRHQLYDIECYIVRATYKAVLLTPVVVRKNKIRDETGAAIQDWFPRTHIEIDVGPSNIDYLGEIVTVTIPEWLINEKGWEDYV